MNKLFDKAILLCLCIIIIWMQDGSTMPIVALTIMIAFSSLCQSFPSSRFSLLILLLSVFLCFVNSSFCCLIPLLSYDLLREKKYWLFLPFLPMFAIQADELQPLQLLLMLFGMLLSLLLCYRTTRLAVLEQELIQTRDTSEEVKLLLQEKNKHLCENQDYEISLATMKERNRIAREIHDNVGHLLTRSILQVGAICVLNKDEVQRESLESLKDTLSNAMTTIRNSVHDLHDDSIDLHILLKEALQPLQQDYHVTCELDFSNSISQNVKLCFLGIVKEAVANVIKHSNADRVELIIREHPAFYQLLFCDNGTKQKATSVLSSGIGLSNMQERAAGVGGIISFTPSPSDFKIFVSVPKK